MLVWCKHVTMSVHTSIIFIILLTTLLCVHGITIDSGTLSIRVGNPPRYIPAEISFEQTFSYFPNVELSDSYDAIHETDTVCLDEIGCRRVPVRPGPHAVLSLHPTSPFLLASRCLKIDANNLELSINSCGCPSTTIAPCSGLVCRSDGGLWDVTRVNTGDLGSYLQTSRVHGWPAGNTPHITNEPSVVAAMDWWFDFHVDVDLATQTFCAVSRKIEEKVSISRGVTTLALLFALAWGKVPRFMGFATLLTPFLWTWTATSNEVDGHYLVLFVIFLHLTTGVLGTVLADGALVRVGVWAAILYLQSNIGSFFILPFAIISSLACWTIVRSTHSHYMYPSAIAQCVLASWVLYTSNPLHLEPRWTALLVLIAVFAASISLSFPKS